MTLLAEPIFPGYPTDYLLSRLRSRRPHNERAWSEMVSSESIQSRTEEELWESFLQELSWVYHQLSSRKRRRLAPLFLWFELRTLVLCLRFRQAGDMGPVRDLLQSSLLGRELRQCLLEAPNAPAVVRSIAETLEKASPYFTQVPRQFDEDGLRGYEESLRRSFLGYASRVAHDRILKDFFRRLIDIRNLVTAYKIRRWQITPIPLMPGGLIKVQHLEKFLRGTVLEKRLFPEKNDSGGRGIDIELLSVLSRRIRRTGRQPQGTGPILDYLWHWYVYTRNLGVLFQGQGLSSEALLKELIR